MSGDGTSSAVTETRVRQDDAFARLVPVPVHCAARPGEPFDLTRPLRVLGQDHALVRRCRDLLLRWGVPAVEPVVGSIAETAAEAGPHEAPAGELSILPVEAPVDGRGGAMSATGECDERREPGEPTPEDPEAYQLIVTADHVRLRGGPAGLSHALATLEQLVAGRRHVAPMEIADRPRFAWRGLMIDLARHMVAPAVLREVVDLMALYRMNRLHLHLTDDQGWRLEIPGRPELLERSSSTAVGGDPGGSLSMAGYRALAAYAARRGIVVVPEIDLPGHTHAALHAVPGLNPDGVCPPAYTGIEVGFSSLDLSLPATAPFLRDVLGAVAAATTGPWVHIGGDEVTTMSPRDYGDIMAFAAGVVAEAGKQVIAWQEGGRAELPAGSLVQLWDTASDPAPVREAVARGCRAVLSPGSRAYLDMKYHADYPLGLRWAGVTEVRDSYDWDPADWLDGVTEAEIEGVEATLFTETVRTRTDLFTMLLPRLAALAEVAWSPRERRADTDGFLARLAGQAPLWRARGWEFHPSEQVPW